MVFKKNQKTSLLFGPTRVRMIARTNEQQYAIMLDLPTKLYQIRSNGSRAIASLTNKLSGKSSG